MKQQVKQDIAIAVTLVAFTFLCAPQAAQSIVQLMGSNSGVQKAVAVDASGNMNVTIGAGSVSAANGGTGQTTYAIGDTLYASASNALSKRAAVATGALYASAGVTTAPVWSLTPQLTAGGVAGGTLYHLPGKLFFEFTNLSNGTDTNFITTTSYSLPAATLTTNGDKVKLEVQGTFGVFASTKTIQCNIGFTAYSAASGFTGGNNIMSVGLTTSGGSWMAHMYAQRVSSTLGQLWMEHFTQTANGVTFSGTNSASITWANAQPIACIAKDGSSNNSAVSLKTIDILYDPY